MGNLKFLNSETACPGCGHFQMKGNEIHISQFLATFHGKYLQGTGSVVILEQNYVYSAYMPLAFEQFSSNFYHTGD